MVVFLTGVMGAGKSYEAVSRIYSYFGKDSKTQAYLQSKYTLNKDIKHLRTNIPYNKSSFTINDNIDTSFRFEKFYEKIQLLHVLYLDDTTSEKELLEHAKEFGIADTFFIIDEAHNYLDKADKSLLFFFTYHRHFHCEVLLITQNLTLVNYKYKGFCEQFVRAVPSTFNLVNNKFTYKYFPSSRMAAKDVYKVEKIKKLDVIFESYTSGGKVFTNNVIKKILITSVVSLVLIILAFNLAINKFMPSNAEEVQEPIQTQATYITPQNNSQTQINIEPIKENKLFDIVDTQGYVLISLTCNKKVCFNDDFSISSQMIKILSDNKIIEILNYEKITNNSLYMTFATSPSFINLFEYKGVGDEKDISIGTDTKYSYTSEK